jgi:hypothetical protein
MLIETWYKTLKPSPTLTPERASRPAVVNITRPSGLPDKGREFADIRL